MKMFSNPKNASLTGLSTLFSLLIIPSVAFCGINGAYDNNGAGPAKNDPGGVGPTENSGRANESNNDYSYNPNPAKVANLSNNDRFVFVREYFDAKEHRGTIELMINDLRYYELHLVADARDVRRTLQENKALFNYDKQEILNRVDQAFSQAIVTSVEARKAWDQTKKDLKLDFLMDEKTAERRLQAAEDLILRETRLLQDSLRVMDQFIDSVYNWKSARVLPQIKNLWQGVIDVFMPSAFAAVSKKKASAEKAARSISGAMIKKVQALSKNAVHHFEIQKWSKCGKIPPSKLQKTAKCKKGMLVTASVITENKKCVANGMKRASYALFLACGI